MTKRLSVICQAATSATMRAAFPLDEALDSRAASALCDSGRRFSQTLAVVVSPKRAARQTANALGLHGANEVRLDDLSLGRWAGRTIADIAADHVDEVQRWISDPAFNGHGGESRTELAERARAWLAEQEIGSGHSVAVTHAAVIKCLVLHVLAAPPSSFWSVDIVPGSLTDFRHDGQRWTLRSCGQPLANVSKPSDSRLDGNRH